MTQMFVSQMGAAQTGPAQVEVAQMCYPEQLSAQMNAVQTGEKDERSCALP